MPNEPRPMAADIKGQTLAYPASQADMQQAPDSDLSNYRPADKLVGKVALITGADSGIGRAVAIAYAMEGADVAIVYNESDGDADTTRQMVEAKGRRCLVIKADVRESKACRDAVQRTVQELGGSTSWSTTLPTRRRSSALKTFQRSSGTAPSRRIFTATFSWHSQRLRT